MYIKTLKLKNYRNYEEVEVSFDPNINIIYGNNAVGKTNLLESIYMCSTSKSHKNTKENDIINFNKNESHIKLIFCREKIVVANANPVGANACGAHVGEDTIRLGELRDPHIIFSTKTKEGLQELTATIEKMFINKNLDFNNEIFISNERQLQSIKNARISLQNVLSSIEKDVSEDFLTIDLTDAYTHLSQVLGIEVTDDLVNEIFSKFCMGK